ncbi:auxin efflux carrier protein [Actibacterium atlanticum]|uniref:Auxin efflux carrier protein n=1 Tax=Actibacterium atlanticum TaxID=1461693 RepID=A0A058ZLE6_9RHOB|nr:AEC family transporter [Actibacterium atlanticum]KCV82368.1 auxin efflux carrier protein [Actibacterium atlanticum]
MLDILGITFPIFALIGVGYFVVWKGIFKPSDIRVLGNYVVSIALPALIFTAVSSRQIGEVLHTSYLAAYALGGLSTVLLAYGWFRITGTGPNRCAIGAMGCTCPNSVYLGYPIMLLTFPAIAEPVLAMNLLVENLLILPLCLLFFESARGGSGGRGIVRLITNLLRRPYFLALPAGLIVSVLNIPVPASFMQFTSMLGASAAALALIVIGGTLVGLQLVGERLLALQIVIGKLLVQPALTLLFASLVVAVGIPMTPEMKAAVILSAAMPMFGLYTVFAQESGHEGLAAIAQLGATAASFVTLNIALVWLT